MLLTDIYHKVDSQQRAALVKQGSVFFLVLNQTDFDEEMIDHVGTLLDQVEEAEGASVLVTTGRGTKVFCTGFSLK
jgi:enoyl-CoA hydratase/carnithine racemase